MSALKHMEFIFGGVMVLGCALAALPDAGAPPPPTRLAAATAAKMPVVVIKGKRMTAMEKRRSLELEAGEHRRTAGL